MPQMSAFDPTGRGPRAWGGSAVDSLSVNSRGAEAERLTVVRAGELRLSPEPSVIAQCRRPWAALALQEWRIASALAAGVRDGGNRFASRPLMRHVAVEAIGNVAEGGSLPPIVVFGNFGARRPTSAEPS